ncbi:hypothetical protein ACFWNN_12005 [Lentzea sp. NPDC058450]|uniref:hypothetical protein n=1 Tax=Lentzea sp. NPDC058450 TaxID=3346505 RepID=UPI00365C9FDE
MVWAIRGEFENRGWDDVAAWFAELAGLKHNQLPGLPSHQHMRDIVASVLASDAADSLGVTTSMFDLVAVSLVAKPWYYETIHVASPSSLVPVREGCCVLLFHGAKRRRQDSYDRQEVPVAEAVPAFWRMVEEKFGITR